MSQYDILSPVMLVGSSGVVANWIVEYLKRHNIAVICVDRDCVENSKEKRYNFDFTSGSELSKKNELFLKISCIIYCTSEDVILRSLPHLCELVPNNLLFVDMLPVKKPFINKVKMIIQRRPQIEWISMQPLFRPTAQMEASNENVVVTNPMPGKKSNVFIKFLNNMRFNLTELSVEEHDAACSIVQAASHVQLFLLGEVLKTSSIDLELLKKLQTPVFKQLLDLVYRVTSGKPDNYFEIQQGEYANSIRKKIMKALTQFDSRCFDLNKFSTDFTEIYEFLEK